MVSYKKLHRLVRGDGAVNRIDWDEAYLDPPVPADETPAQRERRERSERINACLRQLRDTGTVDHAQVYASTGTRHDRHCRQHCGRLATPAREDGLCNTCRGVLKKRRYRNGEAGTEGEVGTPAPGTGAGE